MVLFSSPHEASIFNTQDPAGKEYLSSPPRVIFLGIAWEWRMFVPFSPTRDSNVRLG